MPRNGLAHGVDGEHANLMADHGVQAQQRILSVAGAVPATVKAPVRQKRLVGDGGRLTLKDSGETLHKCPIFRGSTKGMTLRARGKGDASRIEDHGHVAPRVRFPAGMGKVVMDHCNRWKLWLRR